MRWFDKGVEWKVGNGEQVRFWCDEWVGDQSLATLYPRLFLNSLIKLRKLAKWEYGKREFRGGI